MGCTALSRSVIDADVGLRGLPKPCPALHHRPVGADAIKVVSGARSTISGASYAYGPRYPGGSGRFTRASAHAASALTDCSSPLASPAGGQRTARPRPSEPQAEVIFVVLLVRSRSVMSSRVSLATWQSIFFTNGGAALLVCLPVLACERACWPLADLHLVARLHLPARYVCRMPCTSDHAC